MRYPAQFGLLSAGSTSRRSPQLVTHCFRVFLVEERSQYFSGERDALPKSLRHAHWSSATVWPASEELKRTQVAHNVAYWSWSHSFIAFCFSACTALAIPVDAIHHQLFQRVLLRSIRGYPWLYPCVGTDTAQKGWLQTPISSTTLTQPDFCLGIVRK